MNKNKFIVSTSGVLTLLGVVYLFRKRQIKSDASELKASFISSTRLINRLIGQIKTSKQALHNLIHTLKDININDIKQDTNQSVSQLQADVDKLQKVIKQTKNN